MPKRSSAASACTPVSAQEKCTNHLSGISNHLSDVPHVHEERPQMKQRVEAVSRTHSPQQGLGYCMYGTPIIKKISHACEVKYTAWKQ